MKMRTVEKRTCKCLLCGTEFEKLEYTWEKDGVNNND